MSSTCAMRVWDRKASTVRACGAPARYVLRMRGDELFSVCHRHDDRLRKAFGSYAVGTGVGTEPSNASDDLSLSNGEHPKIAGMTAAF